MGNKTIDFRNKKGIKKVETKEILGKNPEVTLKIEFDDNDELIMDLSLLGTMTEKVANELEVLEKKFKKKLELGLLATMIVLGGNSNEIKEILKNIKRGG